MSTEREVKRKKAMVNKEEYQWAKVSGKAEKASLMRLVEFKSWLIGDCCQSLVRLLKLVAL